jgi:hypothetical protein
VGPGAVYLYANNEEIALNATQVYAGKVSRATWFSMKRGKRYAGKTGGDKAFEERH